MYDYRNDVIKLMQKTQGTKQSLDQSIVALDILLKVYRDQTNKKDNKDDWKKLADEITQRYSEQELLISYSVFFDTNIWYKDGFKFIKKYLIEKYPNAFTNQNIIATQKLYNKTQVFLRFEKEEEI